MYMANSLEEVMLNMKIQTSKEKADQGVVPCEISRST